MAYTNSAHSYMPFAQMKRTLEVSVPAPTLSRGQSSLCASVGRDTCGPRPGEGR
jgi:hypothetical protein